jgi:hypothetical protein
VLKLIRAAFPDRPWRLSEDVGRRRRGALGLTALVWTALCVAAFDVHWVHHVHTIGRGPCSTTRFGFWAIAAVVMAGAGSGLRLRRL